MKKWVLVLLTLCLLGFPLGASAHPGPSHHSRPSQEDRLLTQDHHFKLPFQWRDHRNSFSPDKYRLERMLHWQWANKFPGERAYKWHDQHGEGFIYHGQRIVDAVFFYNQSEELISIGFMKDGVFIRIHPDRNEDRHYDDFIRESWHHHHR